jgi:AcrR family transcriptional regulator
MKRRAELEEQTRIRITESTVALHQELGPARTSISAIAERAGVRRSTVYRHFPDENALFAACSSHWRAANPPPDPRSWAAIANPGARAEAALRDLYAFYSRTEAMYASLLRDEPVVPIVRRLLRDFHDYLRTVQDVLIAGRGLRGAAAHRTRAAIGHALAFTTWRSLTRDHKLSADDAVALMVRLVEHAAPAPGRKGGAFMEPSGSHRRGPPTAGLRSSRSREGGPDGNAVRSDRRPQARVPGGHARPVER